MAGTAEARALPTQRIEWVADPARLEELAGAWDALDPGPFGLSGWYRAWWRAFGEGALRVCLVWRDERLAAAVPLERSSASRWRVPANVHTPRLALPFADERALTAAWLAVFAAAREVIVPALPAEGAVWRSLQAARERSQRWDIIAPGNVSPVVDTAGDFAVWRAESKRRWGAPLERFRRKMGREHAADFELVSTPPGLGSELDRGIALEAGGWKGEQGTAMAADASVERFYRDAAAAWLAAGMLRCSALTLDGELAAWDLCALHRGELLLVKTAFDEGRRRLAPGLVLRLSVIERCFELDDVLAHDLLGDDDAWKLKFSTGTECHLQVRSLARGPRSAVAVGYRKGARPLAKRVVRAVRPDPRG